MSEQFTIETLEDLVKQLEQSDEQERAKLTRLITAYARILALREPQRFEVMPLEYADVEGDCDGSYPPKQKYKDFRGPRLIEIYDNDIQDVAESTGFYYHYRTVTTDQGLWVDTDGQRWGCEQTGTGRFEYFPAHPGDAEVMNALEWIELDAKDVPLDRLRQAESELRALAFPLVAKLVAAKS